MPELRWYQQDCVEAVEREIETSDSTLAVLATGLGKGLIIAELAKRCDGPCLVLAHREELLDQLRDEIAAHTGERVDVEQADRRALPYTRIIVGSLATLAKKLRRERIGLERFSLVILDECHRGMARTYREVLESFTAKKVGFTATPDRGDKKGLGSLFKSAAFCMDILEGIEQGYLVPIVGEQVELGEIDLTGVDKSAGDLVQGQLDEVMLRAVEGIVKTTMERHPERRAIAFFPGVKSAEYAAQRFNAIEPDSTCFISGETDPDLRRQLVAEFKRGKYKRLANCMVAIEGFNAPDVSLIIGGRPTLARWIYAQQSGRATRPLPGIVDACPGRDESALRRHLIASSEKPQAILMDFVGNAGKHKLVSPEDLLGTTYTPEERDEAKKVAKEKPGIDVAESLAQARARLAAVAASMRSRVTSLVNRFDPFEGLAPEEAEKAARGDARFGADPITRRQLQALESIGVKNAKQLSKRKAKRRLDHLGERRKQGLASYKQTLQLKKLGIPDVSKVSFDSARRILDHVASRNWDPRALHVDLAARKVRLRG